MRLSSKFKLEVRLDFGRLIDLLTHPFPQHCRQAPLPKHVYLHQSAGKDAKRVFGVFNRVHLGCAQLGGLNTVQG
jgi:hypothetical protein